MPIDPSIPLSGRTPEPIDPVGIMSKMMGMRTQQMQGQAAQLELDKAQREAKSTAAFEQALKDPANRKEDGTIDDARVASALQKQDVGAWQHWVTISATNQKNALETATKIADLQGKNLDNESKQRAAQQIRATSLGKLAFQGERLLGEKSDDPLHVRDTTLATVARAAADGLIDEQQAKSFLMQTAHATPDQIKQVFASFVPADVRSTLEKEAADTAKAKAGADVEAAKAANLKTFGRETRPNFEQKNVTLDGKANQLVNFDPASGQSFLPGSNTPIESSRIKGNTPASIVIHNERDKAPSMPTWATDDSRPTGPDANKLDPSIRMTPNGLHQAALNYIATGQFPPTGRGSDATAVAQRSAIVSKVGAISAASGMDEPALRAFYKSNGASLAQQQKMYDAVQGFMATADKNADLLKEAAKKIPDTGSPMFNKPLRQFEQNVSGNANLSKFATYLRSVRNEYARIVAQPNLAGQLTDSARHEADALLDEKATVPQMLAAIEALQTEGNNRLVSVGDQIKRIQDRMKNPGGTTNEGVAGATKAGEPIKVGGFTVRVRG